MSYDTADMKQVYVAEVRLRFLEQCESRALAAEQERDEALQALANWKTATRTSAVRCATCEGDGFMWCMTGYKPETGEETGDTEVCAECAGTGHGHVAELIRAMQAERDAALSKVAEVERERDAYKRAKSEDDDRFMCERDEAVARERAAIKLAAQIARERDNAQDRVNALREVVERAAKAGYTWAHNALVVIDARGSAAPKSPCPHKVMSFDAAGRAYCSTCGWREGATAQDKTPGCWHPTGHFDAAGNEVCGHCGEIVAHSSVGVAATAEDGREVPAQNRQRAEPPSDPATGTTRREPPESACRLGASTGAVASPAPTGGLSPEQRAEVERVCREVVAGALGVVLRARTEWFLRNGGNDARTADPWPELNELRNEMLKGAK